MSAVTALHRTYWRLFNVLVRLVSLAFIVGAMTSLVVTLVGKEKAVFWALVLSFFLGGMGVLMLRARAFRPDIDGYGVAFGSRPKEHRRWWTGDPVQSGQIPQVPPNTSLERTREG